MTLCRPVPGRHPNSAGSTLGGTAFAGRFTAVAERGHVVMNGTKIGVGMVVARSDVVDTVGTRTTAQMTDAPVVAKDPLALRMPFPRQAPAAVA